jgi:hypothetical protein
MIASLIAVQALLFPRRIVNNSCNDQTPFIAGAPGA